MANEKNNGVENKFSGLPIAELIAAPLTAAYDSQKKLAQSAFEFMTEIGFNPTKGNAHAPVTDIQPATSGRGGRSTDEYSGTSPVPRIGTATGPADRRRADRLPDGGHDDRNEQGYHEQRAEYECEQQFPFQMFLQRLGQREQQGLLLARKHPFNQPDGQIPSSRLGAPATADRGNEQTDGHHGFVHRTAQDIGQHSDPDPQS